MNRVIKFRAYGCVNHYEERMVYLANEDNYFIDNEGELIYIQATEGGCDYIGFDNVQLMQFTGLHDKNGKEIYEKDIVACFNSGHSLIEYTHGTFGLRLSEDDFYPFNEIYGEIEVIGNIYENSDLLATTNK